jgi:hypothetical protein
MTYSTNNNNVILFAKAKAKQLFELNSFINTNNGQLYAKKSALVAAEVGIMENIDNPEKFHLWNLIYAEIEKIEV